MIGFLNTCLWKMNIQIVLIFTIARVQRKEEFIQQGTFKMSHSFLFIEDFFHILSLTFRDNGLDGFGIHTINCTQHPYGDIGLPEMEEIIQSMMLSWMTTWGFGAMI